MTEQTLNEADLLNQMSAAIQSNDVNALSKLFDEGETKVESAAPANEPEPKVEEEVKEEVVGTDSKEVVEEKPTEDWLANIPEEHRANVLRLKEEHERASKELHRYKSDAGRVAAYQRKADQAQKELEQLRKQSSKTPQEDISAALKLETDEDFKQLLEADPNFARMIERQLKKVATTVEQETAKRFQELNTRISQREEVEDFEREKTVLYQAVPNAQEIFEHPAWGEFKDNCPPGVRTLAESAKAEDVILAMQLYGAYIQSRYYQDNPQSQPAQQVDTASQPVKTEEATTVNKIAEERQRKLQGGPGTQPSKPTQTVAPLEDENTLLLKYYNQIRKENGYA